MGTNFTTRDRIEHVDNWINVFADGKISTHRLLRTPHQAVGGIHIEFKNIGYESSGMMASLLGVSYEAFVVDNEMLSHVYRMIRGIEVTEETLAFEAMRNVINGEGHFIGETQTMEAMERDYYYPKLGDRLEPTTWAEEGASDIWQKANTQVRDVLKNHQPNYIEGNLDARLRSQYKILLPA